MSLSRYGVAAAATDAVRPAASVMASTFMCIRRTRRSRTESSRQQLCDCAFGHDLDEICAIFGRRVQIGIETRIGYFN